MDAHANICRNGLAFSANGGSFTNGFANATGTGNNISFTGATALTFKPENPPFTTTPNNDYDENAIAPTGPTATACSDGAVTASGVDT